MTFDTECLPNLTNAEKNDCEAIVKSAIEVAKPKQQEVIAQYIEYEAPKLLDQTKAAGGSLSLEDAQNIVRARCEGGKHRDLSRDESITFDKFGPVSVSEIWKSPDKYHKAAASDPQEPELGTGKAKLYVNHKDGTIVLHSFCHGGIKYFLHDVPAGTEIQKRSKLQGISREDLLKAGLSLSQGKSKIEIISAEEIRALNPQVEPLVEGFLNKGDNTLITAPGGIGKSMFSTHMALEFAVPFPGKLFDRFSIMTRMPSLFFQTENSMATVNTRLSKMAGDIPEYQRALKYINFPLITNNILSISKSLENEETIFWFIEAIRSAEEHQGQKINICVWDPLVSFHDGQENDAGRMRAALDAVTFIAQATDITPIIIHHNNKNGDYRGSSAILDWGRNMISLTREFIGEDRITDIDSQGKVKGRRIAQIPCIRVKHEKSNNMPLFESFLLRMTDKLRFEPVNESIPAKQMEYGNAVSQALLDMGGYADSHNALSDAYKTLSGVSAATAKRHVTDAANNLFIRRVSIEKNGKLTYVYSSLEN